MVNVGWDIKYWCIRVGADGRRIRLHAWGRWSPRSFNSTGVHIIGQHSHTWRMSRVYQKNKLSNLSCAGYVPFDYNNQQSRPRVSIGP